MMFWEAHGDGEQFVIILVVGTLIGALCGAVPLTVGLIRGNKSMAWIGFGTCVLVGIAFLAAALLPAIIFTIIAAVTEPIGVKKKKGPPPRRHSRDRADDFLDDDTYHSKRRRRSEEDDEDDDRRSRRRYDDDDDYDRPRRRRDRYDD